MPDPTERVPAERRAALLASLLFTFTYATAAAKTAITSLTMPIAGRIMM